MTTDATWWANNRVKQASQRLLFLLLPLSPSVHIDLNRHGAADVTRPYLSVRLRLPSLPFALDRAQAEVLLHAAERLGRRRIQERSELLAMLAHCSEAKPPLPPFASTAERAGYRVALAFCTLPLSTLETRGIEPCSLYEYSVIHTIDAPNALCSFPTTAVACELNRSSRELGKGCASLRCWHDGQLRLFHRKCVQCVILDAVVSEHGSPSTSIKPYAA